MRLNFGKSMNDLSFRRSKATEKSGKFPHEISPFGRNDRFSLLKLALMRVRGRVSVIFLILILVLSSWSQKLSAIYVHGNINLSKEMIVRLSGLSYSAPLDSNSLQEAFRYLMKSDCFDTVMVQKAVLTDTTAAAHIFVRENRKDKLGIYGGTLSLTMYGRDKLWFAVTPGYERRFISGKPQSIIVTATFPYAYGLYAGWNIVSFPLPGFNCGLNIEGHSTPYQYSRYYTNTATTSAYIERLMSSRLSAKLSGDLELSKTWLIDAEHWKSLSWQIATIDPGEIQDNNYKGIYPRMERVPSFALSMFYDHRDNAFYPSKGYALFAEARHVNINNDDENYHFQYNQATGSARLYINPTKKQVIASYFKFIVRDDFDAIRLGHRMLFYNEGEQFRGFNSIAGENLSFLDIEYRFRLFEMDVEKGLADINISPKLRKLIRKMNYFAEGFVFVDNGLFFGNVYIDKPAFVPFSAVSLSKDLFTSFGLGGRVIYPEMGYIASAGITAYQHKADLDDGYRTRFFGTLSIPF